MQGTINIKGMSAPNPYDEKVVSTKLTCFKGFTPKTFNDLVQTHVQGGYPSGENGTKVEDPFDSVLNYGAMEPVHWFWQYHACSTRRGML